MATNGKHPIGVHDVKVEKLFIKVVSNAITQGGAHATLVHATGVYTFTLKNPKRRILGVSAPGLLTTGLRCDSIALTGTTTVVVDLMGYADTTATDGDFFLEVTTSNNGDDR